jgi:hypothetical protein
MKRFPAWPPLASLSERELAHPKSSEQNRTSAKEKARAATSLSQKSVAVALLFLFAQ